MCHLGSMNYHLAEIPSGAAGTDATVRKIGDLVQHTAKRPVVRLTALRILERYRVPNRDYLAAASALFDWIRRNIQYRLDPIGVETVASPEITLKLRAGDCDDHSALMAGLAQAVGIPARFRVVGDSPDRFCHIWPELKIGDKWLPADTTEKRPLGERPPKFPAEKLYSIKGVPIMYGLGQVNRPLMRLTKRRWNLEAYTAAMNVMSENWRHGRINRADLKSYLRVIAEGNSPARGTIAEPIMKTAITDFLAVVDRKGMISLKPEGSLQGLYGLDGFLKSIWSGVKNVAGSVANTVVPGSGALITGGGGSSQSDGSYWNRLGPMQAGQLLSPGSKPVDAAYAALLTKSWQANLVSGQKSGHIWDDAPPGAWEEAQKLFAQQTPTTQQVPFSPSVNVNVPEGAIQTDVTADAARAGVSEFLSNPMVLGVLAIGGYFGLKKAGVF